ncbi:MAG: PorT family protein [Bacteroidia bacterium]|nr:PorT family protein [Bacteroidia bacterium]
MMRLIFFSLSFFLFNAVVNAQRNTVQNLPKYDKQKLHFGFLLGMNKTDFVVKRIGTFNYLDSLYVVEVQPTSGFNLGIVSNLRLAEYFDLRFVPDLSFSQRNLIYSFYENGTPFSTTIKQIESTFLEFPLEVKYKSARVKNYRVYVLAGFRYSIDMVSQEKVENKDRDFVRLSRKDYGYTIGLGFDLYMQLFKLSPEIKMYHGIPDLLVPDNRIFSTSLSSLRSKIWQFSLTFE